MIKNIFKALGCTFVVGLGIFLVQNNPSYANDNSYVISLNQINTTTGSAVITTTSAIYVESDKKVTNLNNCVGFNLIIDKLSNISAEDITVKYDKDKLKLINIGTTPDGIRLIASQTTEGAVRFIFASEGETNIINSKQVLMGLQFQTITTGSAIVYADNCYISDGISMERILSEEECGGAIVKINNDVSGDNQFSILDLAIDARRLGETPNYNDEYIPDINCDGIIDDCDLDKIAEGILKNTNSTKSQQLK